MGEEVVALEDETIPPPLCCCGVLLLGELYSIQTELAGVCYEEAAEDAEEGAFPPATGS
jgi:hypothetical protein